MSVQNEEKYPFMKKEKENVAFKRRNMRSKSVKNTKWHEICLKDYKVVFSHEDTKNTFAANLTITPMPPAARGLF
jgi:hypothetical protein